jgi:hypothetical protein
MATVDSMMLQPGADVFYTDGLRNVLEDHMTYLRTHANTRVIDITPIQAHRYEFDLIGLLNELMIEPYLHWTVARMNHFNSFTEVPEDLTKLLVPDSKEINKLQQIYNTTNTLS